MRDSTKSIQGAGLNFVGEFFDDLVLDQANTIKWLEVRPENYLDRGGLGVQRLDQIADIYPLAAHTTSLSVGSPDDCDWDHLKKIKIFIKKYNIPFLTDHLATCSHRNKPYSLLLPIPWSKAVARFVGEKVRIIQDFLEVPFGLENIPYSHFPAEPEISEAEFINIVLEKSNAKLLLDINDAVINSQNYHFSLENFLQELNLDRLIEIHIAGYKQHPDGFLEGTHAEKITDDTLDALAKLGQRIKLPPILLEREGNFPTFSTLQSEIKKLETLWQSSQKKFETAA